MQNPLLEAFDQAPFSKIKTEHYKEAFEKAIEIARAEIDAIAHSKSEPTFENTIVALDRSGAQLDRISSIFFNLNSAETSTEIQEIAQEISPWLSAFKNDIILHQPLFERVKAVVDQNLELDAESQMLLEKQYKSFTRNGALLDLEKQKELRAIDEQLSKLSLEFGQHV
ncbi:MAG: M3 family peptidase, partial [Flavobacteriaceae bacterium]|nr:M3 family peptidase [Flavobacteriaceae bacterium]